MYKITLKPDDNGTIFVTCRDLPEVTTFGEDEEDAMQRAAYAIEEALAARIERREDIPTPSEATPGATHQRHGRRKIHVGGLSITTPSEPTDAHRLVQLPALATAKVELYRTTRTQGVSKAELAARLGWQGPQVDRLFDLNYHSKIEDIDRALRVMGKRLVVGIEAA